MKTPERQSSPEDDPQTAAEVAWLMANRLEFLEFARSRYTEQGRGALVIDVTTDEPFGEDTPFSYAPQSQIAAQEDAVSQSLASIVEIYEPACQFVAVFVQPGTEFRFNVYQVGVGETSPKAVNTDDRTESIVSIHEILAQVTQRFDESDRICDEDIEETKRRLNGHNGYRRT